jgi:hypothetical protein
MFGRFARLAENSREKDMKGVLSFQRVVSNREQEQAKEVYQMVGRAEQTQSGPCGDKEIEKEQPVTPRQLGKRGPQPSFPHVNNHVKPEPRLSQKPLTPLTPKQKVG